MLDILTPVAGIIACVAWLFFMCAAVSLRKERIEQSNNSVLMAISIGIIMSILQGFL